MKAIIYGEVIWDVYPDTAVIGGAPFNFSAHLAHLGDDAHLITAIGNDDLGNDALNEMKKHGIHTDLVQKNDFSTGKCLVTLDENGIPSYNVLTDTAYDNITLTDDDIAKINGDVFYFNTLIQRNPVSKKTLEKILEKCSFPEIFCDINIRENCYCKESLELCMKKSTIVKISDEEGHFLEDLGLIEKSDESFPKRVLNNFPDLKQVVYTLGKNGSMVQDRTTLYMSGIPPKVNVVSTVGAGDCFGATYLHYIMNGATIEEAIKQATLRSNIVVSHKEAIPF
ncbi:MAG: hypothetical protein E7481_04190 [Ruminococcaceae bacterium]|nr:hypothetical protein [Oscillospiraceae bacterium]